MVALACMLATGPSPAVAEGKLKSALQHKAVEHVNREPFGAIPKGPLQIIISINQQQLHLYSDGTHVADTPIATGVPGHATPLGVFSIIEKDRYHQSNIYSGAPMPYMQRVTWSGVAIHEGVGVGHPASHGCVRMPRDFAARLWVLTKLGARVIIARPELRPEEIADPHLFVHKEKPVAPAAAPLAGVGSVKTAQSLDAGKTSDIAAAAAPPPAVVARAGGAAAADPEIKAAAADATPDKTAAASEPAKPDAAPEQPSTTPAANDSASAPAATVSASALAAATEATGTTDPAKPAPVPADVAKPAVDAAREIVPVPLPKPADIVKPAPKKARPIAIFVSRKTSKIYVRQNFAPLFDAPITIDHAERPLGTHVFTAMQLMGDGATFRWTVISLPGEQQKSQPNAETKSARNAKGKRKDGLTAPPVLEPAPPETPQQALARIEIAQDVIDRISELMVPGSSLIVSDQGLGGETGEGTDFIVVTRDPVAGEKQRLAAHGRHAESDGPPRLMPAYEPWQQGFPWR